MLSNKVLASSLSALVAFTPALASAATPNAFLERSQVLATGKTIKAYRVPIRDYNGTIKYRDVTINLGVTDTGNPDPLTTTVSYVASPNVQSNQFVAGNYVAPGDFPCVVSRSSMTGGRVAVNAVCTNATYKLSLSWVTGPISGHLYENELTAAEINLVPGYQNLGWGIVNNTSNSNWFNTCFASTSAGGVIGAAQVGGTIDIKFYGDDKVPNCGVTLEAAAP